MDSSMERHKEKAVYKQHIACLLHALTCWYKGHALNDSWQIDRQQQRLWIYSLSLVALSYGTQCWPWAENITSDRRPLIEFLYWGTLTKHSVLSSAWKNLPWTQGACCTDAGCEVKSAGRGLGKVQCFPSDKRVFSDWENESDLAEVNLTPLDAVLWLWRQGKFLVMWVTRKPLIIHSK